MTAIADSHPVPPSADKRPDDGACFHQESVAVMVPTPDEEALARWDDDGASARSGLTAGVHRRTADAERFLRFIGLTGVADVRDGEVSFPLGILWPYTIDLRRVRTAFDAAGEGATGELLTAIATLHERIAFAPGSVGRDVADVYNEVTSARAARGFGTPTLRGERP